MTCKNKLYLLILLIGLFFIVPLSVRAEGTKDMYDWNASGNNDRLFFYYSTQQESGVDNLLKVHVYAKEGEKIKFATSGNGAVMHLPSGTTKNISVNRTNGSEGFIYNSTQEKNKTYTYKTITATETGVYTFDMTNQTKTSSGSQYPDITSINATYAFANMSYGNSYIAAWDIQVANNNTNINGRVWLDYVAVYRGYSNYNNYSRSNIHFYVLTSDGYKYRLKLSSFDPGGMLFFISTRGIINKNNTEIVYKTVAQNQVPSTYLMPIPTNGETEFDSYGKIFFNEPSDDLPNDISKDKLNARITEELTYNDGEEKGYAKLAGIFKFVVSEPSTYTITIKNRDTNQVVRTISNTAVEGENTVIWDGKNNSGSYVAAGNYHAEVNVRNGEYHFILGDVEKLDGGLTITSEDNNSRLYYDNSSFNGANVSANGIDSSVTPFTYTNDFGDLKLVNTWTYTSSQSSIDLIVLDPADETKCVISGRVFKDNDNSREFNSLKDEPLSGVKVYAKDNSGNRYTATTVTNGEFAIIVPKGTTYTIGVDNEYKTTYLSSYTNTTNNETQTKTVNDSINVGNIGYYSSLKKITLKKEWNDSNNQYGFRPSSVIFNIKNGDTVVETVQLKENSGWTKIISLPKYDSNGNEINYTVDEEVVNAYYSKDNAITIINNLMYTIINGFEIPNDTIDINIKKEFNDNNNYANRRPNSIKVKLYRDNVVDDTIYEVKESNDWKLTISDLPKYDSLGNIIVYTIEEVDTGNDFYVFKSIDSDNYDFTINNDFKVPEEKIKVKIVKKWEDSDDRDGIRPDKVTMKLYANRSLVKEFNISSEDDWTYLVEDLDRYDEDGLDIEYSIQENDTDEYTIIDTSITSDEDIKEIVSTSSHERQNRRELTTNNSNSNSNEISNSNSNSNEISNSNSNTTSNSNKKVLGAKEENNNPKTLDNIYLYIIIFISSIIGLIGIKIYKNE